MAAEAAPPRAWAVAGSYFEACNCEAICPCRRVGERAGGRSTYGICQFALSWQISRGPRRRALHVDDAPLSWDLHRRCGFATGFSYSSDD
ncbi:MAG TPA: DUF1326 domain-containing protein [Streptosporangiaceae bacterium]|jgi:hypothetical protein|nr:DUF1326 domain-containing protein [Streptosporangiaceae bacterium]